MENNQTNRNTLAISQVNSMDLDTLQKLMVDMLEEHYAEDDEDFEFQWQQVMIPQ
jgi:Holliday junction resolvase RusA-like endonuclease